MNLKQRITRTVILFVGLSLAGIGIAGGAQWVPAAFIQTVMVAVGSAIFGAGLAFFLIRMSALLEG